MREVIDAEYEVVGEPPEKPFRIPWGTLALFCIYLAGFAGVAMEATDPVEVAFYVIGASLIWPTMQFLALLFQGVSEREERQLRQRLLHRRARARAGAK